jgi:RimJ/RimL family protein N-acetyltransferase
VVFTTPTLTTDRRILRVFREEDLDAYVEICADAEVTRYPRGG